jgi:hypothetical protein
MRRGGVLTQSRSYEIDEAKVAALANFALSDLDEWQGMPLPQRAFLVSLRRLSDGEGPIPLAAKRVKDLAEIEYGPLFTSSRSRQLVQDPLEAAGWIVSSGGTGGRGAKGGLVEATPRLMNIDLDAILGFPVPALPADLRTQLNRPLAEVERDLRASSTFVAGVALELLALKMSVALGLIPVELRKRDDKTGGGEVDLLAEGAHLHFSRWLFQCKNQRAAVPLSALAKEIGMAVLLKAQVIVLATTGRFASSVYEHADQVAETTAMQVVLIDGAGLRQYLRNGDAALQHFFRTKAAETLALKQLQRLVRGEG